VVLWVELVVALQTFDYSGKDVCGILLQYPATDGALIDYTHTCAGAKAAGVKVVMAADLLALTMVKVRASHHHIITAAHANRVRRICVDGLSCVCSHPPDHTTAWRTSLYCTLSAQHSVCGIAVV